MMNNSSVSENGGSTSVAENDNEKSPTTGVLLSLFGGTFGLHRFYLHQYLLGFVYCVFWFTLIPGVLGIIEAFYMKQRVIEFNENPPEQGFSFLKGGTGVVAGCGAFIVAFFIGGVLLLTSFKYLLVWQLDEQQIERIADGKISEEKLVGKLEKETFQELSDKDEAIARFYEQFLSNFPNDGSSTAGKYFTDQLWAKLAKSEKETLRTFINEARYFEHKASTGTRVNDEFQNFIVELESDSKTDLSLVLGIVRMDNQYKIDGIKVSTNSSEKIHYEPSDPVLSSIWEAF